MKATKRTTAVSDDGERAARRAPARRKPELDPKLLRTFATIVDLSSFTRAGRRLGLSQSAISQQIAAQERQLGVKLLVRAGSGVRPTPAGEILLHYARQILTKVDEAQRVLTAYDATGSGVLRIGAGGAACEHLLPQVLQGFHAEFPHLELRVRSGPTALSIAALLAGDLDVALLTVPVAEPKLRIYEIGRDELVAIVPPGHPWAGRRRLDAAEFAGQPLLVYERRSSTHRLIERALLEAGVFPHIVMELDHLGAVTRMVRAGLGLAIVPRWAVADDLAADRVASLPVGPHGLFRSWGLALRAEDHQPQTQQAFVRACLERLPALVSA